jgi:hypothetical protein
MKQPEIPKSGKCGDKVWQFARHGQISYPAFIPANPRTPAQLAVRRPFGGSSAGWRRLTQAQRDLWNAAARDYNSSPKLAQRGPLTGQQLYVKINTALACQGRPQVDIPPPYPVFPLPAISGLTVTNVRSAVRITLVCPLDPGDRTILRASRPQNARRKTCSDVRIIGLCPSPVAGVADITAPYRAKFGVPRVGSKIFLQVNQIIDGWEDAPCVFWAIVPAPTRFRPQLRSA